MQECDTRTLVEVYHMVSGQEENPIIQSVRYLETREVDLSNGQGGR